ncbi:MAG TPA: MFS transporter [bacterium]|nr:MFS transporter [bacterium]HOM27528.1 MFS transporter [bacterium]
MLELIKKEIFFEKIKTIFRSLQYRNYRLFFIGQSISLIGTWVQRIALPWLVYHLTHSTVLLGITGFAEQIPTFLLATIGGVVVDRKDKYRILLTTQILATIQALILAILTLTGTIKVWEIIFLGIFLGCINAFDMPSRQAFVVDIIEKKEDLPNAIALNSSMVNSARVVGPSLAGIIIGMTNEGICFLINAISYIFVVISLLLINIPSRNLKTKETNIFQELKEGFLYVKNYSYLKYVILLLALVSLMGMPYTILMPVFVTKILKGTSKTFGFLMAAGGFGALIGAFYLAGRKNTEGLEKIIKISAIVFGSGLIMFSISRFFSLALIFMVITGFGMVLQIASSNTFLQSFVDDDKRGRVMSFYTLAFMGTAPFGSLLAGYLGKFLGVPLTLFIGGFSCIIGALIFSYFLGKIEFKS